jgi:hypothetical protein
LRCVATIVITETLSAFIWSVRASASLVSRT